MNIGGKKFVMSVLAAMSMVSSAFAGDREWATAGKILTGVAVVHTIDHIVNPRPEVVYVQPAPVVVAAPVVAQPVVVAPAPQVVYVQPVVYYYPAPVVVRYGYCHPGHYRRW